MRVTVALPPRRAGDITSGVHEVLNSMVLQYNTDMGGIILAYRNLRILSPKAELLDYLPFLKLDVEVTVSAFCPEKGMRLGTDQEEINYEDTALHCDYHHHHHHHHRQSCDAPVSPRQ